VFVGAGYYDLATPFISVEYAVNHMGLDPKLRDHVSIAYYQAGHMMYIDDAQRHKLHKDVDEFINSSYPH
jgi:carboxypeptidase C (cathepsin A)